MRFINKHNIILLFILLLCTKTQGQTLSGYALNMGGDYSSTMEWNIGESVSIANFKSSAYALNTGLLQPMTTVVTGINEYGPTAFGIQVVLGPNPTSKILHIKASFNEVGNLTMQLFDSKSAIVSTQELGTIFNIYENEIFLETLPAGAYYLNIYFKSMDGKIKSGIYKIMKL